MRRLYLIVPAVAFALFACFYFHWRRSHLSFPAAVTTYRDEYAGRDGQAEAERDVRAGKLVVLSYGLPVEWSDEYDELLKQQCQVEVRWIAGCVVTDSLTQYASGYNNVMVNRIQHDFGRGIFDDTAKEAEKLYAKRHPENRLTRR